MVCAFVVSTTFEFVAARCSFWPACTVSHFILAQHAYLRSARAPLNFWDPVARMTSKAFGLRHQPGATYTQVGLVA
eukprot:6211187-Pleurochrysis_carterae.AAC.7